MKNIYSFLKSISYMVSHPNNCHCLISKIFTVVAVSLLLISLQFALAWKDYKILKCKSWEVLSITLKFHSLKRWSLLKQRYLMAEIACLVNLSPVLKEIPLSWAHLNNCSAVLPICECNINIIFVSWQFSHHAILATNGA